MEVQIDVDRCIGSGGCVIACPEVFDLDEDGLVVLLNSHPPDDLAGKVAASIDACPASVISIH